MHRASRSQWILLGTAEARFSHNPALARRGRPSPLAAPGPGGRFASAGRIIVAPVWGAPRLRGALPLPDTLDPHDPRRCQRRHRPRARAGPGNPRRAGDPRGRRNTARVRGPWRTRRTRRRTTRRLGHRAGRHRRLGQWRAGPNGGCPGHAAGERDVHAAPSGGDLRHAARPPRPAAAKGGRRAGPRRIGSPARGARTRPHRAHHGALQRQRSRRLRPRPRASHRLARIRDPRAQGVGLPRRHVGDDGTAEARSPRPRPGARDRARHRRAAGARPRRHSRPPDAAAPRRRDAQRVLPATPERRGGERAAHGRPRRLRRGGCRRRDDLHVGVVLDVARAPRPSRRRPAFRARPAALRSRGVGAPGARRDGRARAAGSACR